MKKLLVPILLLLFSCNSNTQRVMDKIGEIPKETKKSITSKYYIPIFQDGEWICGSEELHWDENSISNTVYLDEFGNSLLKIERSRYSDSKGLIGYKYELNIYYSPKESKLSNVYVKEISWNETSEGYIDYIRDEKGLIIETKNHIVKGSEYLFYSKRPQQFKHDKDGNLTEIIEGTTKSFIKKSPPSNNLVVRTIQVIDDSVKYDYNSITGLTKQITEIYESDNLKRAITEEYMRGNLISHEDVVYFYDNNKHEIRKEMNGKCISLPHGTGKKELDDYFEHYYSDQELKEKAYIIDRSYNKKGDVELYIVRDLGTDGKLHITPGLSKRFEYIYNSHGDWIKRVAFPVLDDDPYWGILTHDKDKNAPELIGIREIKYY